MSRTEQQLMLVLCCAAALLAPASAFTQTKTKKPIKEGDARRVIAAMSGFALNRGAVKVKEIAAGAGSAALVTAEVETAIRFRKVAEEEGAAPRKDEEAKWRAVEFRSGDRSWEEFAWIAEAVGSEKVDAARRVLEELAAEFEAKELARVRLKEAESRARDKSGGEDSLAPPQTEPLTKAEKKRREREAKQEAKRREEEEARIKAAREVARAGVRLKEFSPLLSSAVAICFVEATFRLEKGADGKWHVAEFTIGDASSGNLTQTVAAIDAGKAARARVELETLRTALESFRRERGFYVVASDATVLTDHLSPHYLENVIRIDPWHRPYKYAGTREHYTLRSDGADGVEGTADDVTLGA